MSCMRSAIIICASLLGAFLIILGAVLGFAVLPDFVDSEIKKNVELVNGTDQKDRFMELPFPLDFKVYFFHVTNPDKVMTGDELPNVIEIPPIVYNKNLKKTIIKEIESEATIEFFQLKFHSPSDKSEIAPETKVTVLNIPIMGVLQKFEGITDSLGDTIKEFLFKPLINEENYKMMFNMAPDTIFHEVTVHDYAFNGYKFCDPTVVSSSPGAKFVCALIRIAGPESLEIQDDRVISFSFFTHKNNRTDGIYKMGSGTDSVQNVGQIRDWNHADRTSYWKNEGDCNVVRGCDSTIYPPFNDKNSRFYVFNTDICRTVQLEYDSEIEYEGISGYKSYVRSDSLDMTLEKNRCYCLKKVKRIDGTLDCLPSGFMDMSSCLGAPVVLSFPHFLWAADEYKNTVTGLSPNEAKHRIFIDMEPNTGSPMRGGKRVQFNMITRPISVGKDKLHFINMTKAVVPVVWVDESVTLPDFLVEKIKSDYVNKVGLVDIVTWVLILVGLAMFVAFGIIYYFIRKKSSKKL